MADTQTEPQKEETTPIESLFQGHIHSIRFSLHHFAWPRT